MKEGDKIYCIKNNYGYLDFDNDNALLNEKGKFYRIDNIGEYRVLVTCNTHHLCEYYLFENKNERSEYCNWNRGIFYDYFITEQQLRKEKIKKINNE